MNNLYNNFCHNIGKKYSKLFNKHRHDFDRIVSAIQVIETYNRFIIWRCIEYIVVIFELSGINKTNRLTNYSIGKYQIKISMILDYFGIEYRINKKVIYLGKDFSRKRIIKAIRACNNSEIVKSTLRVNFPEYNFMDLGYEQLKELALYYSRNIEFKGVVNYLNVLEYLYYYKYDDLVKVNNNNSTFNLL